MNLCRRPVGVVPTTAAADRLAAADSGGGNIFELLYSLLITINPSSGWLGFVCDDGDGVEYAVLVSAAKCVVGGDSLRMVGSAEYRHVRHRRIVQNAPSTVLGQSTEHAVDQY